MQHRLLLSAATVVALAAPLSSCGFDYATDRVYQPGSGANNRDGAVDVLVTEHLAAHAQAVGIEVHHEPPWRWPSSAAL